MRLRHAAPALVFVLLALGPAPAQTPPAVPPARVGGPTSLPVAPLRSGPFTWTLHKGQLLRYALEQTVTVRSNLPGAEHKPPLEVRGQLEIRPVDEATALLTLQAQFADPAPASAPATAPPPAPAPGGFSCGCPAARPRVEPPPPPPPPPAQRSLQARFELRRDGQIEGSAMSAGGQTELMVRLLMPLPGKALQKGEVDSAPIDAPPVTSRFGLLGTRTLTYVEDRVVKGRPLAVLRWQAQMVGEGQPGAGSEKPGQPSRGLEGTMELKAEGEGLFDLAAGRYQQAQSTVWLQINTAQQVDGVKKAVTLEQTQETRVRLDEGQGP